MMNYSPRRDLLSGRIVLVTGAGDGIGRAAAMSYAAHGARVILAGRTVEKLEHVYDEIIAADGPEPAIYPIDLRGAGMDDYWQMGARIEEAFGRLDGLLHNAAVLGPRTPIETYDADAWMEVMQVNVNAMFMLTRAMLPLLRQSEDASIIATSSGVGRQGRAYWGGYAVSKFATEGFVQVLADELASTTHIRVNSLNPGATRTNMRRAAYPGENAEVNPRPEEIMGAYLYLMGPDSHGVTGRQFNAQQQ